MGLFRSPADQPYSAIQIDQDWIESGALSPPDDMEDAIHVKPHEDDGGISTGTTLLEALHDPHTQSRGFLRGTSNVSPVISFEMKYSKEAMGFWFVPGSADLSNMIRSQLGELYPDSDYERRPPELLDFQPGHHISAAYLTLDKYALYPIKHVDLEGFDSDPLGSIAAEMIGLVSDKIAPADVAVQVILKPATRDWTKGVDGDGDIDDVAHNLKQPEMRRKWSVLREPYEVEPSQTKKKAAKLVQNQAGKQGWWINIRVIAESENPDEAKRRARKTAKMFERFYLSETEQRFNDNPRSGDGIRTCVEQAVRREYIDRSMVKAIDEAGVIAHIPGGDINVRDLERSTVKGDNGTPPGTPQFTDYDETGYSDEEIPRRSWERFKSGDWDWPYNIRQDSDSAFTARNTHEWSITAREPGMESSAYAGAYPRAMIENSELTNQPLWFGLDSNQQPVPVLENELFRHMFIAGQTGAGKSTAVLNILMQHAFAGRGFTFVDPGGEDSFDLLRMLPEDRLDDVVFIDVTDESHDKTIGFNFLETFHEPGEPGFDSEVEGIVSDILPLLAADDHPRMKGVASNVLRALVRANHHDEEYTYAPIDLFYMLSGEESRQEYARFVREEKIDPLLEPYADQIGELDNSDLEPLVRRLKKWVESPKIRPLVSQRNSPMSIADAIEDNRILVIKCDAESYDVREMVAATITRKIWSVVTARPSRTEQFLMNDPTVDIPEKLREASAGRGWDDSDYDHEDDGTSPDANADAGEVHIDDLDDYSEADVEAHDALVLTEDDHVQVTPEAEAETLGRPESGMESEATTEHEPYFLTIDELHSVITDETQIDKMLAEARKKRLGLVLLTQQTHQLPDEQRKHIMSNCSTLLAFKPGAEAAERASIAAGFPGLSKDDLSIDRYHAWTTITNRAGEESEPFITALNPPYPPRRGLRGLRQLINRSIEEYGSERLTSEAIAGDVNSRFKTNAAAINPDVLAQDGEATRTGGGPGIGGHPAESVEGSGQADPTSERGRLALYKAIHTVQIRRDALNEPVHSSLVKDEWARQLSGSDDLSTLGYESIPDNLIEEDPHIERSRRSGEVHLTLGFKGLQEAGLTFNTGSSASGGKDHHRMVLKYAYYAFTKLGYDTWLPEQEGDEEGDGMANLPRDPSGAGSFREARRIEEELREELVDAVGTDAAVDLSDGRHVSIEAETSTMLAPEQTLTNLRKAIDEGRFCVFACKDEHSNEDHNNDTFYWPKRGEKIIYDTYRDGYQNVPDHDTMTFCPSVDDDGNRTFYNRKKGFYKIGGEDDVFVLRKRSNAERDANKTVEIVWEEEQTDGGQKQIVLRDRGVKDGEGGYRQEPRVHMRFNDPDSAASPERADVEAYYGYDTESEEYVVRYDGQTETYETKEELFGKWSRIYPPFIPEANFPREPTEDDFLMVVFPDDDNPDYDVPMIYEKGDIRPLFTDELSMPEVPEAEEIEAAVEEGGKGEDVESDGQDQPLGQGQRAFDQEGENSRIDELTDIALEVDGVNREQAEITARQVDSMQVPWEVKTSEVKRLAPHWTGSTDGGVPADDASAANGAGSSDPGPSQPDPQPAADPADSSDDAAAQSDSRPQQTEDRSQSQNQSQGQGHPSQNDHGDMEDTAGIDEGSSTATEGANGAPDQVEAEPETPSTFRDELQATVDEQQTSRSEGKAEAEAEDGAKVETMAGIYQRQGLDEDEAKRKAELQVYGEVRSKEESQSQQSDGQASEEHSSQGSDDEPIALPAADQPVQDSDSEDAIDRPDETVDQQPEAGQQSPEVHPVDATQSTTTSDPTGDSQRDQDEPATPPATNESEGESHHEPESSASDPNEGTADASRSDSASDPDEESDGERDGDDGDDDDEGGNSDHSSTSSNPWV